MTVAFDRSITSTPGGADPPGVTLTILSPSTRIRASGDGRVALPVDQAAGTDRNSLGWSRRLLLRKDEAAQKQHCEPGNEPANASNHDRLQQTRKV
jgi:hypothetical protein